MEVTIISEDGVLLDSMRQPHFLKLSVCNSNAIRYSREMTKWLSVAQQTTLPVLSSLCIFTHTHTHYLSYVEVISPHSLHMHTCPEIFTRSQPASNLQCTFQNNWKYTCMIFKYKSQYLNIFTSVY